MVVVKIVMEMDITGREHYVWRKEWSSTLPALESETTKYVTVRRTGYLSGVERPAGPLGLDGEGFTLSNLG